MSRRRTFDWDEAARLHASGETYEDLARRFAVHPSTIQQALNPRIRAGVRAYNAQWREANRDRVRAYDRERKRRERAQEQTS